MKAAFCLAAFVSVALGVTVQEHQDFIKRQTNVQNQVQANAAAMTDQNGNVLPFDAKNVYLDMKAKGL
ncbi:hypothetical protein SPI_06058 [Niveomyces insectorum RCEF 264]|uniref:Uncharacterized protein n=1 Tax=Niveomyces insectorum RCEF 264 TaxID=1081102 RepID=A0A167SRE9_9HYPO|nr:hypothetical protein SPI_06058 [Niveomyces insectorum RCEF 264]